jgi:hypothetical protein
MHPPARLAALAASLAQPDANPRLLAPIVPRHPLEGVAGGDDRGRLHAMTRGQSDFSSVPAEHDVFFDNSRKQPRGWMDRQRR